MYKRNNKIKSLICASMVGAMLNSFGVQVLATTTMDENTRSFAENLEEVNLDVLMENTKAVSYTKAIGYGEKAIGGENTAVKVFEVRTRDELKNALSAKVLDPSTGKTSVTAPRVIVLMNDINLCVDSRGKEFIPGVSSTKDMIWTSGSDMAKDVILKVNSNTTILGKYENESGEGRTIYGGGLKLSSGTDNVIIKHINFADAYDFFPEWDGSEWNTELDNLTLEGATNVWIDHCTFSDGDNVEVAEDCKDINQPIYHDGLLDIKKGSDLVTISNCVFENHKKAILIGHSDSASSTDAKKLRVTFTNNYFNNIKERMPRVRYGNIHSFNNYYTSDSNHSIGYVYGMGINSTVYSEDNIFDLSKGSIYKSMNSGTATYFYEECGSILNGKLVGSSTYGATKPAYTTSAKPSYKYTSIDVTESNYNSVKNSIISNAGHKN
ncbi:MAG: pectate lyase [Clostridium perfringens]|nr:pectate lyase [Clostridium perfringens]